MNANLKELGWAIATGVGFVVLTELATVREDTLDNPTAWASALGLACLRAAGQAGVNWFRQRRIQS